MALNIPMPGSGMNEFSSGMESMFQSLLEKRKRAEAQDQFRQSVALKQQREDRLRGKLADEHQRRSLIGHLMGSHQNQGQQQLPMQDVSAGVGGFTQDGLDYVQGNQGAQADAPQQPEEFEALAEMVKGNGMPTAPDEGVAEFAEEEMGPDEEEEEEEVFEGEEEVAPTSKKPTAKKAKKKEKVKAKKDEGKGGALTPAIKTKMQNVVTGVDSALPILNELVSAGEKIPRGPHKLSASQYAAYEAKVNSAVEPLLSGMGLNATDKTAAMVSNQIKRQPWETTAHYKDKLKWVINDLQKRQGYARDTLEGGRILPGSHEDRAPKKDEVVKAEINYDQY